MNNQSSAFKKVRRKSVSHSTQSDATRPIVIANFVMTWDGKISTRNFTPADFSSANDKRRLLEIRAAADAILVGANTVAADQMSMGIPAEDLRAGRIRKKKPPHPLRVIISNSGKISRTLKIFQHDFSPIAIYSTTRMPKKNQAALAEKATLHLDLANSERVDLAEMLRHLRAHYRIKKLVCEGGPTLFRSLLANRFIDELYLTLSPHIFGGKSAPTLTGIPADFFPKSIPAKLLSMKPTADGECFLHYRFR